MINFRQHSRGTPALIACLLLTAQLAAQESNPLRGTWTLNVDKSSIDYAPLPGSEGRTYESTPNNGMIFTVEGIDGAGVPYSYGSTAAVDGRQYALPGTGTRNGGDTVSWTLVDANTIDAVVWKLGEVVNRVKMQVSDDGMVLTMTENGTGLDGMPTRGVRIYDRQ